MSEVEGRVWSSTMVTCQGPRGEQAGVLAVEVSSNGVEYARGRVEVWYQQRASVTAVRPSTGPEGGGAEVRLYGEGMVRGGVHSLCRFGAGRDRESPVRWESSSVVACTTPGSGGLVGNVTVELVGEEGRVSGSNGVRYEYGRDASTRAAVRKAGIPDMRVEGLEPSFGTLRGGTMVTMTGSGMKWEDRKSTRLNSSHSQQSRMPSSA